MPSELADAGAAAGVRRSTPLQIQPVPSPKHVVLVTDSLEPSGVGEHMLTLARGLLSEARVTLACPSSPGGDVLLASARDAGIATQAIDPKDDASLRAWLSTSAADVVHVHAGIGWEGHGLVRASRAADAAVVLRTEHLPYLLTEPRQVAEFATTFPLLDQLVCVSQAARQSHISAGFVPEQIAAIANGITPRALGDRKATRETLGLSPDSVLALTVARFTAQKDHATLLEAAQRAQATAPNLVFLLVGSGPLEPELRTQAAALGLENTVCFLGQRADIPDLLAAADLFALPSLFEGLPLVVLEAMAAGLPVVGTDIIGTAECVDDGHTGLLVPPRDPAALAAALTKLANDPARRRTMGRAGQQRFAAEFTAERMVAQTLELYRQLAPQRALANGTE